jgi:hypothetical protein
LPLVRISDKKALKARMVTGKTEDLATGTIKVKLPAHGGKNLLFLKPALGGGAEPLTEML